MPEEEPRCKAMFTFPAARPPRLPAQVLERAKGGFVTLFEVG